MEVFLSPQSHAQMYGEYYNSRNSKRSRLVNTQCLRIKSELRSWLEVNARFLSTALNSERKPTTLVHQIDNVLHQIIITL